MVSFKNDVTSSRVALTLVPLVLVSLSVVAAAADDTFSLPGATDLTTMLYNLQQSLIGIWDMLMLACWMFGLIIFTLGMLKLKKYGQMTVFMMSHADIVGPIIRMIVGSILLYVPWSLDMMLNTLWGGGTTMSDVQGYAASPGGVSPTDLMGPVFTIVQVIGFVAFIRGLLQLTKAGEQGGQPGTVPRSLMLMFGGVMAINIVGTIDVLRATFGLT